jgi:3-dehydroquinate dehydratase / shikimate dehydrogenase
MRSDKVKAKCCLVLSGDDLSVLDRSEKQIDLVELRLDCFDDLKGLKEIVQHITLPIIFTLRGRLDHGAFKGDEAARLESLLNLLSFNPDYVDIEHHVDPAFLDQVAARFPQVKIIRSYHHFEQTPNDLEAVFNSLKHPKVSVYKLITTAKSSIDSLRLMRFLKSSKDTTSVIVHAMGEAGEFTRVMGAVLGNAWTYATFNNQTIAPGVLSLNDCQQVYGLARLSLKTRVYALIGDPVSHSIGHKFHNKQFMDHDDNAVYVKIPLKENELADFFELIKTVPIDGLSVTAPLKAAVLNFIDQVDPDFEHLNAQNTLKIRENHISSTNTDVDGAMVGLKNHLKLSGKNILLLGAGGASRAIVFGLMRAHAKVTIMNRSFDRAAKLAALFDCKALALSDVNRLEKTHYDIVINALPAAAHIETNTLKAIKASLKPDAWLMDITHSKDSPWSELVNPDHMLYYDSMFIGQALLQRRFWGFE